MKSVDAKEKISYTSGMTPEQCRAARGWLGWSQHELAERAHVGLSTVRDFEAGRRQPIENNRLALRRVFEASGVIFLFDATGRATGIGMTDTGLSRAISNG
jgi:DNA-binding transcriptional regulator YiaG